MSTENEQIAMLKGQAAKASERISDLVKELDVAIADRDLARAERDRAQECIESLKEIVGLFSPHNVHPTTQRETTDAINKARETLAQHEAQQ